MTFNGWSCGKLHWLGAHVLGDRLEFLRILIERGKRGVIMNMIVLYYPFYFLQFPLIPNSCYFKPMTIIRLAQSHDSRRCRVRLFREELNTSAIAEVSAGVEEMDKVSRSG